MFRAEQELTKKLLPRVLLPTLSAVMAVIHPDRADLVGVTAETIATSNFTKLASRLKRVESGRDLLRHKPRISAETLLAASRCEPGTLGHMYADFMIRRGFQPQDRPPVRFIRDTESQYVAIRCREVHDLLHVLFDCPTTLPGELAIKAIEFTQYELPAHWGSAYFASGRLNRRERKYLASTVLPWAVRAAGKATDLLSINYEKAFNKPIIELRKLWRIETMQPS